MFNQILPQFFEVSSEIKVDNLQQSKDFRNFQNFPRTLSARPRLFPCLNEGGRFKTVIQKQEPTEKENEEEDGGRRKKKRIETNKKEYKILGGELKDMEIEPPIDWQKRRREIPARLEEEEKTRLEKREGEKTH